MAGDPVPVRRRRLTLNILLSFAQFEREIISERTRDKMSAARRKGKWIGGHPILGYDIDPKGGKLIVNSDEAQRVGAIYKMYLKHGMMHTYTAKGPRRYRYYVCYKARQKGWQNCKTKSVAAEAIERAVLNSIRRLSSDPLLAERVLDEAVEQFKVRKKEVEAEQASMKRSLSQLNQELARLAAETEQDTGARFDRIKTLESAIRTAERQLGLRPARRVRSFNRRSRPRRSSRRKRRPETVPATLGPRRTVPARRRPHQSRRAFRRSR
jgi:hypothetical protein